MDSFEYSAIVGNKPDVDRDESGTNSTLIIILMLTEAEAGNPVNKPAMTFSVE